MVLERDDAARLVQRQPVAERVIEHVRAHAGVVLVDEAQVGAHEAALAGLQARRRVGRGERVAIDDLLEQRARRRVILRGSHRPQRHVAQLGLAVGQQATDPQDRRGQGIAPGKQLLERDRLAALDAFDQPEVGAGQ